VKEIDLILTELTGMLNRWELFRRFMYSRLVFKEHVEKLANLGMLEKSKLREEVDKLVRDIYKVMETWYLRSGIEKVCDNTR
jgi:conserved oligomeric Golgi complex subunit 4